MVPRPAPSERRLSKSVVLIRVSSILVAKPEVLLNILGLKLKPTIGFDLKAKFCKCYELDLEALAACRDGDSLRDRTEHRRRPVAVGLVRRSECSLPRLADVSGESGTDRGGGRGIA